MKRSSFATALSSNRHHFSRRLRRLLLLNLVTVGAIALATPAVRADGDQSGAARDQLIGLLENVSGGQGVSYQTRDSTGYTTDTIKIVAATGGGYVGVYHVNDNGFFSVRLGFSHDLLHWTYVRTLQPDAVQPTIAPLPNGAYLVAYERRNSNGTSHLEFRDYPTLKALLAGHYDRQFDPRPTLSTVAEGTPSIHDISWGGSLAKSTIDVGFHFYDVALGIDLDAHGVLRNFSRWSSSVATDINGAFDPFPAGGVGARDSFVFEGYPFTIVEGWGTLDDWSTWRVYLYDETAQTMTELTIHTALGSTSFGTPHVTILSDPAGNRALVVSFYLFTPGAVGDEAGPLIYYTEF